MIHVALKNSKVTATVSKLSLKGHKGPVVSLVEFDKASTVLSSSEDRTVRLWDIREKNSCVRLIRIPPTSGSAGFAKSAGQLVVVSSGNRIFGYDLRADSRVILGESRFESTLSNIEEDINDFDLSDKTIAAPTDEGFVRLIALETFSETGRVAAHENIASVARFLPSGVQIASGGYDCKVAVSKVDGDSLRTDKGFLVSSLIPEEDDYEEVHSINPPFVTSMQVSRKNDQVAIGAGDGTVVVLDLHRGGSRIDSRRIAWGGARIHSVSVSSIDWADNGDSIWSVGNDSVLLRMDQVRLQVRYDLGFKPNSVLNLGGSRVAVGGLQQDIEIIDFR